MIEFCTRRRMVISIVGLGVLTVLVLILEESLTSNEHWKPTSPTAGIYNGSSPISADAGAGVLGAASSSSSPSGIQRESRVTEKQKGCWLTEDFKIVANCASCTDFEINSGSILACKPTGFKETVHCKVSGAVFRSCTESPTTVRAKFLTFEALMLLIAVVSYGYCKYRTSVIERETVKRIERRLASGM